MEADGRVGARQALSIALDGNRDSDDRDDGHGARHPVAQTAPWERDERTPADGQDDEHREKAQEAAAALRQHECRDHRPDRHESDSADSRPRAHEQGERDGNRQHQIRRERIGLADRGEDPPTRQEALPDRIEARLLDERVAGHQRGPAGDGPGEMPQLRIAADGEACEVEEPHVEQEREEALVLEPLAVEALRAIRRERPRRHVEGDERRHRNVDEPDPAEPARKGSRHEHAERDER